MPFDGAFVQAFLHQASASVRLVRLAGQLILSNTVPTNASVDVDILKSYLYRRSESR